MKLVIYNRLQSRIAHLLRELEGPKGPIPAVRTLCGRMYPGHKGPQIIYTNNMRLCEVCESVMNSTARKIDAETGEYLHG